jgi:NADH:ubiquinone oxidoreductase subunit 5 (subunit L)/multisubunit Na+/H+ antiporter MnhA subunit
MVTERLWRYNFESLLAFASLALLIIVLIVIWTGYQKRMRSAWFVVLVFVTVYFLPVYMLNIFRIMKNVGWHWWSEFFQGIGQQQPQTIDLLRYFAILIVMIIALLIPVRAFFGKTEGPASG